MRILHVASFIPDLSEPNGAAISAMRLARNQARFSEEVVADVLNVNDWTLTWWQENSNILQRRTLSKSEIARMIQAADIVHFNAVYPFRFLWVARQCRRTATKYVISPRGNLMRSSLKKGFIKKKLGDALSYRRFILGSDRLHFLTSEEVHNSRSYGKPYSIISNSVAVPDEFRPPRAEPIVFGFLGRLDIHHKGLDLLVEGVSSVATLLRDRNAKVVITGSDHRGGHSILRDSIAEFGVEDLITLTGPVSRDEKDSAFSDMTVFVHTSRYEGQPLAILEALARGRPCLVTPGTNMVNQIEEHGLGLVAQANSRAIGETLRDITRNPDRITVLSRQCRDYAERYLRMEDEAHAMLEMYNNVRSH